jgi:tetratricopeptide (TPR) repeat protein
VSLVSVPAPVIENADAAVRAQIEAALAERLPRAEDPAVPATARASEYGELGRLLLAASLYSSAQPALANAAALAPADPAWPYYLAHAQREQGAALEAAALFEAATALAPDDVAAHVWLGRMRLELGDALAAREAFAAALALSPGTPAARAGVGRAALALGDHATAVRELEATLAAAPFATSLHYPLGQAYRGLGDAVRAEEHLRQPGDGVVDPPDPRLVALDDLLDSALAHQRRGLAAVAAGAFAEGVAAFRRGLEVAPNDTALRLSLMNKLGLALWFDGQVEAAVQQFEAGIALSPGYALNHYSLGVIDASTGAAEAARARFAAAVAADPDYIEARVALGNVLHGLGQPADALPHYNHALAVVPGTADARYGLALALVDLDRVQEARVALTEGLQRHPDDARFRGLLGALLGF